MTICVEQGLSENDIVSKNDFPIKFRVPEDKTTECLLQQKTQTVKDWFLCMSPLDLSDEIQEEGQYTLRIRVRCLSSAKTLFE